MDSKTETVSDNEAIAQFMGLENAILYVNTMYNYDGIAYLAKDLKYDSSWDWLMPVVEKVDDLDDGKYIVTIEPMITIISNMGEAPIVEVPFDGRLKNTYKAVVEFIRWYNSQSPATIK